GAGPRAAVGLALEMTRLVGAVLEHEMSLAVRDPTRDRLGELRQEVALGVVEDGVHGVEPEAVEAIFEEPEKRVLDEEPPHGGRLLAVEVDRIAPRRLVTLREELRRVVGQ